MEHVELCDRLKEMLAEPAPKKPVVFLGLHLAGLAMDLEQEILHNPDTENAEIWTVNDWHSGFPNLVFDTRYNLTRCFQLHSDFHELRNSDTFRDNYFEWEECCNRRNVEVISFVPIPGIKNNTIYPVNRIIEKFDRNFFTSSMNWMLALAVEEGFDAVFLRRIKLATKEEHYTKQQSTLLYACRHFEEKYGIKIDAPWRRLWEDLTPEVEWDNLQSLGVWLYGNPYGLRHNESFLKVNLDENQTKKELELLEA